MIRLSNIKSMLRCRSNVTVFAAVLAVWILILFPRGLSAFDLPHLAVAGRAAVSDSARTVEEEGKRSMDLLKEVLDRETGEPQPGISSWHRKKSPKIAMLSALVFPGLGQMYNEKTFKAVVAMGFEVFYLANILHNYRLEQRETAIRDSYPKYVYIEVEDEEPVAILNYPWREHNAWVEEYRERQVDYIWWSAGCILVIVLDAYVDAHLHDMNFRIETSPINENPGISLVIDF